MNPPESWLVEAVRAQYDLDNILLEEVKGAVQADFDLEYLLLEGNIDSALTLDPFPNNPLFLHVYSVSLLKTL